MDQKTQGITEYLTEFSQTLQSQKRRPRTIGSYGGDVSLFTDWFRRQHGHSPTLTDITTADICAYRTHLHQACRLTPNTVNRRLAGLRVFFGWAVDTGHLTINPAARIHNIKLTATTPRWLSQTEQQRLLKTLKQTVQYTRVRAGGQITPKLEHALRDQAVILTLLNTGLRALELAQLRLADVTLSAQQGSLYVRDGKGGQVRTVPLNGMVRDVLSAYLNARPNAQPRHLFVGKDGPLSTRQVLRILKKYARASGLDPADMTAHNLRHTFGRNLIEANVNLEQVARLMGHASLETTRRYTTPGDDDLQQAVEKVGGKL